MYELNDEMFGSFKKIENYKLVNGEHRLRILPPFAANKLYSFIRLHWGYCNENNKKMPLRCLAGKKDGAEGICPLCRQANDMKIAADNLLAQGQKAKGDEALKEAASMGARATYIWQILTEEGQHKTMSLSYRAHEALMQKVGFWWKQKNINITNPERNYKIYCNRTGKGAQTNYAFEVLDGVHDIRKIDVPKLFNLDDVHLCKSTPELLEIIKLGYVPVSKKTNSKGEVKQNTGQNRLNNVEGMAQMQASTSNQTIQKEENEYKTIPINSKIEIKEPILQVETISQTDTNAGGFGNFTSDDIPF